MAEMQKKTNYHMGTKEQGDTFQKKLRKRHPKHLGRLLDKGNQDPGPPYKKARGPASKSKPPDAPFGEAQDELPAWLPEEDTYELSPGDLHKNLRDSLSEEMVEPQPAYEIDLRIKILKHVNTKGVIESEIRQIPGVTIVASHGDPRAKYYMRREKEEWVFSLITVRFYPRWPVIGKMSPREYKIKLYRAISKIPGVAPGIGVHGGVKPVSNIRQM